MSQEIWSPTALEKIFKKNGKTIALKLKKNKGRLLGYLREFDDELLVADKHIAINVVPIYVPFHLRVP